jgi:carbonic anhydrase/acetyltransferase-like protein (isoleucine patch superfamily)
VIESASLAESESLAMTSTAGKGGITMRASRLLLRSCLVAMLLGAVFVGAGAGEQEYHAKGAGRPNVEAEFSPEVSTPRVDQTAYLDPDSSVIGNVAIGRRVYVAPFASVRGDEGQPIHVGDEANVQDGVIVHALKGEYYEVGGRRYAVYLADRVSLAHQAQVHGPALIEEDTFVGMQAFVFQAHVGKGCVIEPGAKVLGRSERITIPDGRYVMAGTVVTTQAQADALPRIDCDPPPPPPPPPPPRYPFCGLNAKVVEVNTILADAYNGKPATAPPPSPTPGS